MARKSALKDILELTADIDYLPGSEIVMRDTSVGDNEPAADPSIPVERNFNNAQLVYWGADNNYPKRVIETAIGSPELLALIDFMVTVLYGDGIGYEVYAGKDMQGNHAWKPAYDQEVEDWILANNLQENFLEKVMDLVWFNHGFTECITNKKRTKIVEVAHQEACFCRFGTQNPKTGYHDMVYVNANWPAGSINDAYTTPVFAINPRDSFTLKQTIAMTKYKFMYPTSYPSPGKLVYQLPGWHSLFPSKWFDISKLIPVLKHALMKYQMTIKYVIEVPQEFWEISARDRDLDWKTMTPAAKIALKKSIKREMDKFLSGAENAGKTFMVTFGWDKINKVKIPGVSLTVLDDKLKDGKYIMDSKEASGQFSRAFTIPQPLMGPISAGDMGAGSGSDARIHWNMLNARMKSRKVRSVADYNFAAAFNGWTARMPGFRFCVKDIVMDTLDLNHSTSNSKENKNPTDGDTDQ